MGKDRSDRGRWSSTAGSALASKACGSVAPELQHQQGGAFGSHLFHCAGQLSALFERTANWQRHSCARMDGLPQRIVYQVHDVKSQVQQGANAIGRNLGDGWYSNGLAWIPEPV